jgi:4-hydroxy-tetrahydrodipicolinate reductase
MGRAIVRVAKEHADVEIVGGACALDATDAGRDLGELAGVGPLGVAATADLEAALLGADVVIDFSHAAAVPRLVQLAERQRLPLVSGTTGLSRPTHTLLDRLAEKVPVLWAPNMSLGVQVLVELVSEALRRLGPAFDVEVVEVHHGRKVDAPSGTAHRLVDAITEARPELCPRYGREGVTGTRPENEVGVFALRGGDVIGDHTIHLLGLGERLELTHRATHRDLFAHGALRAAAFLLKQKPRLYTVADVVGAR